MLYLRLILLKPINIKTHIKRNPKLIPESVAPHYIHIFHAKEYIMKHVIQFLFMGDPEITVKTP